MSPADKFLIHNKDNMFMSFRTQKVDQMYFYNRQKLSFVYETDWGLSFHTSLKAESNEPTAMSTCERYALRRHRSCCATARDRLSSIPSSTAGR